MFIIVSVGMYNPHHVTVCTESVKRQSVIDRKQIVICDEADTDAEITLSQTLVIKQREKKHAARNIAEGIQRANGKKEDVVCLVDLDDCLLGNDSLKIVEQAYRKTSGVLMTYGSYATMSGRHGRFLGEYNQGEDIRTASWKCSHLKTFKVGLWDYFIKHYEKRLKYRNQWIESGSDMVIMMNLFELAGIERTQWISEKIYLYNDISALNDHKVRRQCQKGMERFARNQPPLRRI